jgi:hypothetical protein
MKKAIVLLAVALALPTTAALAKGKPTNPGKSKPKVTYVLKGVLSAYTPATSSSTGSITIMVKHSNRHGRLLKNMSLTFTVTTKTRVTYRHGTTLASSTATAKGVVKVRAPKRIAADLATTLQTYDAGHVIVQKQLTS